MEKKIIEILKSKAIEIDNFNNAVLATDFKELAKELDALFAKRIVMHRRELLTAYDKSMELEHCWYLGTEDDDKTKFLSSL